MFSPKNIRIYHDGLRQGSAPVESIMPTDKSDMIDTETLSKIQVYAQRVIAIFGENPKAEDKFKDQLYSLVGDITSSPAKVKLLLEKISSSDRLSDKQKTQAMLDIMEKLSLQNPILNLGDELSALRQKILSGEIRAHAETFARLHEMKALLKSGVLKI